MPRFRLFFYLAERQPREITEEKWWEDNYHYRAFTQGTCKGTLLGVLRLAEVKEEDFRKNL